MDLVSNFPAKVISDSGLSRRMSSHKPEDLTYR